MIFQLLLKKHSQANKETKEHVNLKEISNFFPLTFIENENKKKLISTEINRLSNIWVYTAGPSFQIL